MARFLKRGMDASAIKAADAQVRGGARHGYDKCGTKGGSRRRLSRG